MPSKLILNLTKVFTFIVAGLIKTSIKGGESLNDMQGYVNLSGQAIMGSLLYLKIQR